MTSGRFVTRGMKTRMFGVACCLLVLCALVFVFHDTQSELEVTRTDLNRCSQIKESLHVQLQGMVDYKIKLENSLTEEKTKHKNEVEKMEASIIQEKIAIENIKRNSLEINKDVSEALQKIEKEYKELKNKYEEESNKRMELEKLNEELENKNTELLKDLRRKMIDNEELIEKSKCTIEPNKDQDKKEESGKGAKLMHGNKADFIQGSVLNGSTTPFINPQAVSENQDEQLRQSLKTSTPVTKVDKQGVVQPVQIPFGQEMSKMAQQLKSALNVGGPANAQVGEENANGGVQIDYNDSMKAVLAPPGGFVDDNAANEQVDEKPDKKFVEKKDKKPIDDTGRDRGFIPAPPGLEREGLQKPQEEIDREPKNEEIPRNMKNDYQVGEDDKDDDETLMEYMDNDIQPDVKRNRASNLKNVENGPLHEIGI